MDKERYIDIIDSAMGRLVNQFTPVQIGQIITALMDAYESKDTEQLDTLNGLIDFGDYISVEQKRYGTDNEKYSHKVIEVTNSNCWVDVPVESPATESRHGIVSKVIRCVCCGVDETEVLRFRYEDVKKMVSK